ncbi:hypothetical protein Hanom_Chr01g00038471 [Helianthus anomalus]
MHMHDGLPCLMHHPSSNHANRFSSLCSTAGPPPHHRDHHRHLVVVFGHDILKTLPPFLGPHVSNTIHRC